MDEEKKKCKLCDIVPGAFGILLGAVIVYIGVDLVMNGKLSKNVRSAFVKTSEGGDNG